MIEKKLCKIFVKLFNISEKKVKESQFSNTEKWDSFTHVALIVEIEKEFKIKKIKPSELVRLNSYKNCLNFLQKNKKIKC